MKWQCSSINLAEEMDRRGFYSRVDHGTNKEIVQTFTVGTDSSQPLKPSSGQRSMPDAQRFRWLPVVSSTYSSTHSTWKWERKASNSSCLIYDMQYVICAYMRMYIYVCPSFHVLPPTHGVFTLAPGPCLPCIVVPASLVSTSRSPKMASSGRCGTVPSSNVPCAPPSGRQARAPDAPDAGPWHRTVTVVCGHMVCVGKWSKHQEWGRLSHSCA